MKTLVTIIHLEMGLLLAGLAVMIAYQMVTGKINTQRMLFEKAATKSYSPLRVQLLLFTLMTALYQILQLLKNPTEFPSVPYEALLVLGGGHLAYLGGKLRSSSTMRRERKEKSQAKNSREGAR